MLDDLAIAVASVTRPYGWLSRIVRRWNVCEPLPVSKTVSGVAVPLSSAATAVTSLNVGRRVGEREDGSGPRVHGDRRAPAGTRLLHAARQFLFQNGLPDEVDGQDHVLAVYGIDARPADDGADDAATVALDGLPPARAPEVVVEKHLDARDAVEVVRDVAQDVRGRLAIVVEPPVRPLHDEARNGCGVEPLFRLLVQVADEDDVLAAGPVGDALPVVVGPATRRLAENAVEAVGLLGEARDRRVGGDLEPRRVDGECAPGLIQNLAPLGRKLHDRLGLPLAPLAQLRPLAEVDAQHLRHDQHRQNQKQGEDAIEAGEDGVAGCDGREGLGGCRWAGWQR